jgi:ribonuclease HI
MASVRRTTMGSSDHASRGVLVKKFHVDGAGARPDGTGSGLAWVRIGTEKCRVKLIDGLSNNQAEYRALIDVLKYVAQGSSVCIKTDSLLVVEQFRGRWAVNDPILKGLLAEARNLVQAKKLEVEVEWIPRERNLAGKILDRR